MQSQSGLTPQQQQQLQQMMLMQGNMMYNAQFPMPGANVGHAQRPASTTPPPGMAQLQHAQQYQQPPLQQPQQPQQQHSTRVSDTGDDGFDLDDIPSPGASPAGAGTGPAAAQQQQQIQQAKPQQQHAQYNQPNVSQPATAYLQQQPGQLPQQQHVLLQPTQQLGGRQQVPQQQTHLQPPQQQQQQPRTMQQQPPQQAQAQHQGLLQMGQFHKQQPQLPAQPQQPHGLAAATRPGAMTPQQQLAAADQVALHSRKGGPVPGPAVRPGPNVQQPAPGQELPAAAQAALAARQGHQQPHMPAQHAQQQHQQHPPPQQGQQAAAVAATPSGGGTKRKREAAPLLLAPDDAISLETVIYRQKQGLPLAGAAGGAPVDGPAVSVDDILKKYEAAKAKAAAAAGPKPGKAGSKDGKRADDETRLLPESQLKRLMELQGLNKSFKLQPELADELMKLTDNFVTEAVEFGCALAARRSSKVLRTSDLAMYMQRTYHLHIPGFSKEYTPYRRPVASDLHKARSVAVRKAQLQPQQSGAAGAQGAS